jgi:hypothetical protein
MKTILLLYWLEMRPKLQSTGGSLPQPLLPKLGRSSGGMGNTPVGRPEGAPCSYHNKSAASTVTRWPPTLLLSSVY